MAIDLSFGADVLGVESILAPLIGLTILLVVAIVLKGLALYKAARLQEKVWFWALLLVNTWGILDAIYLYIRRKQK
jgi:hypothetical protein